MPVDRAIMEYAEGLAAASGYLLRWDKGHLTAAIAVGSETLGLGFSHDDELDDEALKRKIDLLDRAMRSPTFSRKDNTMPAATINGQKTKPMPASIVNAMNRGVPKTTAMAKGPKPVSTVWMSKGR